ncbi:hypothetical protein [Streptomyces sp. NBC_00996]|uniref:hypothetical protein n=1 Tax=Streptomyces sp. NBC_00996 TaxID=2903710 RepID=UPI0038657F0D|nr:hypothetical protein OG390_17450 [Streptomyces sp. NBC_00996]
MSGHTVKARTDHQHAAQQARQMPGQWVLAGTYGSGASATSAALQVRTGERLPTYRPAGAFRARTEVTQDGADLWVCYVAPSDQHNRDFRESIASGLTEDLDAYSRRLEAATTDTARRTG